MQNKIIGIAKNYLKRACDYPILFSKPWSSINRQGNAIRLRENCNVFYEFELGVVIGKEASKIDKSRFIEYIGGYVLALDITDMASNPMINKKPTSQLLSKGQDQFTSIAEFIDKEEVKDCNNINLELLINGKQVQLGNTKDFVCSIGDQISIISHYSTLYPGDILLTGTFANNNKLYPGDKLYGSLFDFDSNSHTHRKIVSTLQFEVANEVLPLNIKNF